VTDVTEDDAVAEAVARAASLTGRLDGVVNAAGVAGGSPVHLLDPDEWDRIIAVNLTGTYRVCRHALSQMLGQDLVDGERGALVTLASIEGIEGTAVGSAYNASKGGCGAAHQEHRHRLRPPGDPGQRALPRVHRHPHDASGHGHAWHGGGAGRLRRGAQAAAQGPTEEIAASAAFLLTGDASFITGQAVVVDGGYTAGRDHGITQLMGL